MKPRLILKHRLWEGTPGGLGAGEGQGMEGDIDLEGQGHWLLPFLERVWNSRELSVQLCAWKLIFVFPDSRYKEPIFCQGPISREQGINESGSKATSFSSPVEI